MYEELIAKRLSALRGNRASARSMSLDIGQSEGYINSIESNRMLPSMRVFFYICEYLNVTPAEFFDEGNRYPAELRDLIEDLKSLDKESLEVLAAMVKKLRP